MVGESLSLCESALMAALKPQGLHSKLVKAFLLQIALISAATLLGVFSAEKIVEKVLVRQALVGEAKHFWKNYSQHPDFPKPDTLNLKAYLVVDTKSRDLPGELKNLKPGFFRTPLQGRKPIVYIEDQGNARLYLVFDEQQVAALAFYFGVVPLSLVLVLIYLFAWLSYRQSRKAISPVIKLAGVMDKFDFRKQSLGHLDLHALRQGADSDVTKLLAALERFTHRMEQFIDREKQFTRDASHELRTPLAVIKSSLALLQKRQDFQQNEQRSLQLIDSTLRDMEGLLETLLLLAREESNSLGTEDVLLNDLLVSLIEQIQRIFNNPHISIKVQQHCLLLVAAPEKVLSILFTNLLRNAFSYTQQGLIELSIDRGQVSISDTGMGIDQTQLEQIFEPFYRGQQDYAGYGLGLNIVKRLCNRYDWRLSIRSKPGEGTRIVLHFPDSKVLS